MSVLSRLFLLTILFCFAQPSAPLLAEEAKVKAADLVKDGQLIDLKSARYQKLFKELREKHKFSQPELDRLFGGVAIRRRVLELMDSQWEAKPYYQYHPLFVTSKLIREGKQKRKVYATVLDAVEKRFGVERDIVLAIWGIESRFGKAKGAFSMFRTLNTMFDAYPRRSDFYRGQLVAYLLLCRENGVDPLGVTGSYGGAFGQTQFIPSSFREYAVDFDKDGKRDVWNSVPDVLASIANYLYRFGWKPGVPVYWEMGDELKDEQLVKAFKKGRKGMLDWQQVAKRQGLEMTAPQDGGKLTIVGLELKNGGMRYVAGYPNFQAITKWNNSNRYAMAVTELAERLAQ